MYQKRSRDVYAIPGNHDWYDGLTAFIRLFCQTRWIGCWRTRQTRSYFAIRLPHGWWLWGLDMALEDDLDGPQIAYFTDYANILAKDDKVILCVPNPTWAENPESLTRDTDEQPKLGAKFNIIHALAAGVDGENRVAVAISGDLHHYARHEVVGEGRKTQYITCGGGGAVTLGTSAQPQGFSLPKNRRAELRKRYPSDEDSRRLRWGALILPFTSPGFAGLIAAFLLLGIWLVHLTSPVVAVLPAAYEEPNVKPLLRLFAQTPIDGVGVGVVALSIFNTVRVQPLEVVFYLFFVACLLAFARSGQAHKAKRFSWILPGLIHAVLQLGLAIFLVWAVARVVEPWRQSNGAILLICAVTAVSILVFSFNGILFGAYILASNILLGMHEQEVFTCQAILNYKSFLRIHLTEEGITIYPIGLRRSSRRWKLAPGVKSLRRVTNSPYLSSAQDLEVPAEAQRLYDPGMPLEPHLIEDPITVV